MRKELYRYRPINEYTLSGLENNQFYFASPSDFNDPFDCKNLFTFEGSTDKDWRVFLKKSLSIKYPDIKPDVIDQEIIEVISSGEHRERQKLSLQSELWGGILKEISDELGVVCLSKKNDDILMWSHYADSHRGICLIFDQEKLKKRFFGEKVVYKTKYPDFKEFVNSDLLALHRMFLLRKSNHWKYEKEFRLFIQAKNSKNEKEERIQNYPEDSLVGVIFGCEMSSENRQKIYECVNKQNGEISFYQAIKSSNSYSLNIKIA